MSKIKTLPTGWAKKRLENVSIIQTGIAKNQNSKQEMIELPYLRVANVQDGYLDLSEIKTIKIQKNKKNRYRLEDGDVLLTEGGDFDKLGRGSVWKGQIKDCVHQNHVFAVRPKKNELLPSFLSAQTGSSYGKRYFLSCSKQSTNLASINSSQLKAFPVILPPLPEQKAIADLLSTWDEAIEKTEQLIQAKEKRLKKLSRSLLFGRKRLKNQKNDLDDGRFFKYPSDWGLATIGEVAKEISVRNGESEETVLSCSKYDGFVNSLDYFGKQVFSSDTSNYKVVKKGQFGYPSNHVEEGSIGLLEHCEKGIVSPIYVVFEAAKEKVYPAYLYKLLKTDIYRHIFQVSTSSSVDRRGSLRWGDFSKIKVLLPSLEEQQQIADTLSTAQQEINLLKQIAEKYKAQKRGLMQKVLTGEWRIKPEVVKRYA
ncbi:restriction endonuclease subunit S [Desulfobulbus sp. US4]|nr:restriction endonuclease subunit S [Desulfobulbus sp. US4]